MSKELVISATPHETRVAILEDGLLCEIYIEREKEFALVGSIYKGRVTRVLPGMQSAFVDIGLDSDAFLYVGDFLENLEDYDHVVAPVEDKVAKDGAAGRRRCSRRPTGGSAPRGAHRAETATGRARGRGESKLLPHSPRLPKRTSRASRPARCAAAGGHRAAARMPAAGPRRPAAQAAATARTAAAAAVDRGGRGGARWRTLAPRRTRWR